MSLIRGASVLVIASSLLLAGCGHMGAGGSSDRGGSGGVFVTQQDPGGFSLFKRKAPAAAAGQAQNGIGVNSYLWRAALDTVSFMPLKSADPWGGVIITDWYSDPASPDEQFQTTVFILDTRLRADALDVRVHKQVRTPSGWTDTAVSEQTNIDVENSILTRARQLRLANAGN